MDILYCLRSFNHQSENRQGVMQQEKESLFLFEMFANLSKKSGYALSQSMARMQKSTVNGCDQFARKRLTKRKEKKKNLEMGSTN